MSFRSDTYFNRKVKCVRGFSSIKLEEGKIYTVVLYVDESFFFHPSTFKTIQFPYDADKSITSDPRHPVYVQLKKPQVILKETGLYLLDWDRFELVEPKKRKRK